MDLCKFNSRTYKFKFLTDFIIYKLQIIIMPKVKAVKKGAGKIALASKKKTAAAKSKSVSVKKKLVAVKPKATVVRLGKKVKKK